MDNQKITVMGIGGVGGMIAAMLLKSYGDRVSLVARGARAESIRKNGLTLQSDFHGTFTVPVSHVSADPADFGVQDLVLVCVKNNDIETAAKLISPIVGAETIVVPVMNGVSAGNVLRRALRKGIVPDSVIYTVSSSLPDFTIRQEGQYTRIVVGDSTGTESGKRAARLACDTIAATGMNCTVADDVQAAIWSKYVLNCAYNVVTARWGIKIGPIKREARLRQDYYDLMDEARQVGLAMGVKLPDTIMDDNMAALDRATDDSDSSLGRDFTAGRVGEMEIFSGELLRMAKQCGIAVPVTEEYYAGLKERTAAFKG